MNLYKKNLKLIFLAVIALSLFLPALFPFFKIQYFIPFLIILIYRKSFIFCLWASMGCGLVLDLLSPHDRIGLYAITYTMTTGIIFRQKRHFFADSLTTLPLMTLLFSIISTAIQALLFSFFQKAIILNLGWIIKDLVFFPLLDMVFAFMVFILPFALFGKPIRKGKDYFSEQEES